MNKNTKQVQQRKARAAPSYADDTHAASDAPKRWSDYTVQFEFPEPTELPPPLIQLNDVSFQYPGRDDFGLKDLNIGVDMGSRVAIVGPNGAGKTTLMNLLSGLPASSLLQVLCVCHLLRGFAQCAGAGPVTLRGCPAGVNTQICQLVASVCFGGLVFSPHF